MFQKSIFRSVFFLLAAALTLVACDDNSSNGDDPNPARVTEGVFVVNEGSFQSIPGSLSYVNLASGTVTPNLFSKVNGKVLGGTANDALTVGDRLYIAVQEENTVWVVNATTAQQLAQITVEQPRELATDGKSVFVSSWDGRVHRIGTQSMRVEDKSDVVGQHLEGLAVRNGHVYVCNSTTPSFAYLNTVVKLSTATLDKEADITVTVNPTQIENTPAGLYLISTGDYFATPAQLQHIGDDDKVKNLGSYTMMAAGKDRLLLANAPYGAKPSYAVLPYGQQTAQPWGEAAEVFAPYAMAVDETTGDVFITSTAKNPATGMADYTANGYMMRYTADGKVVARYEVGLNPGTIVLMP